MENPNRTPEAGRVIDLTSQTDVQFWCRVFDVDMAQLRDAVHHAGHTVEEVQRYLAKRQGTGIPGVS